MIRAQLKEILCPDVPDLDFSSFRPSDTRCFSCALQLLVGIYNEEGAESFQLTVCTPQWLIQKHSEEDIVIGKNLLIVLDFNYPRILQWLNNYIDHCTGETWDNVAKKINRIASGEFD